MNISKQIQHCRMLNWYYFAGKIHPDDLMENKISSATSIGKYVKKIKFVLDIFQLDYLYSKCRVTRLCISRISRT